MKRRMKRSTKQYIFVSFLCILIIGGAFIFLYFTIIKNMKSNYQQQLQILKMQLETNKVYVYEAVTDIPAGTMLLEDNLKFIQTYSGQAQEYFMTKDDIGKVSLVDIHMGTQILKGMLTDHSVPDNIREVECSSFRINSNMKSEDCIDLRIMFPNGEDYIVLSKKNIKNLTLETNNCFLWLTEEEILNISSAIVDAYMYKGTKLYTTKYIEPNLQKASIPTYHPSLSTLKLMEDDENIVNRAKKELERKLRMEMENRLTIHSNLDISEISWTNEDEVHNSNNLNQEIDNIPSYDTNKNNALNNNTDNTNYNDSNHTDTINTDNNKDKEEQSIEDAYFILG